MTVTLLPTPSQAIRQKCRECLNLGRGQRAYDCLSHLCPLYPYSPFLSTGKRKRPVRLAVKVMCRECLGVRATGRASGDCGGDDCPLYPLRPAEIGGPRRIRSSSQNPPPGWGSKTRFVRRKPTGTTPPLHNENGRAQIGLFGL